MKCILNNTLGTLTGSRPETQRRLLGSLFVVSLAKAVTLCVKGRLQFRGKRTHEKGRWAGRGKKTGKEDSCLQFGTRAWENLVDSGKTIPAALPICKLLPRQSTSQSCTADLSPSLFYLADVGR